MTAESPLFHSDPEDIFAKAIERVEAGEAVEVVLATVPEPMRPELRELLLLITATHHLQRAPVPQTPAPRRAERKAAFLQAAAQMKAESAVPVTPAVAPPAAVKPVATPKTVSKKPTQTPSPLVDWLRNFWRDLQAGITSPNLRLAPLLMIIAAVWAGGFGFSQVANAAGPGDLTYPVKQWIDYQELTLSPPAVRDEVYSEIEVRLGTDVSAVQAELDATAEATGQKSAVIITESLLIFNGVERGAPNNPDDDYLLIGPLRVMMRYQPDPNDDQKFEKMSMPGIPEVGSQVALTFQAISTKDDSAATSLFVQGMSMTLIKGQLVFETRPTLPTILNPAPMTCPPMPSGWVPYTVLVGDTLSEIAQRTGTTVEQLQRINCQLDGDTIVAGAMIVTPKLPPTNTPTPTQPPLEVTLTAISTTVLTPSIDITATVTVVPTDTVIITPTRSATVTITVTMTAEATTTMTATVEQTPTLVQTPTPPMTATLTVDATGTVTETATATVAATMTPTPVATVAATATMTDSVELATNTPTSPTATPPATVEPDTPGDGPTATATEAGEQEPTASPTPPAASTPTPTAQDTPTRESQEGGGTTGGQETGPTPTPTPIPQNRSPLPSG